MDEGGRQKTKGGKCKTVLKTSKRGGVRSKKNRDKKCLKNVNFSIMGTNAAGLKAKKDSLMQNIKMFNNPSCITIQESKLRNSGSIKLENYQIFEKNRSGFGGGLLTAVDQNLEPVLIESANDESEILVVQCQIEDLKLRIINGYGPQEDDPVSKRLTFWQSLEQEIVAGKNSNCMILIQMDGNAKVGKNIISQDPNNMSDNGRLLLELIERESLVLLNSSDLCQGSVTRHRVTKEGEEKSILDYIITCDRLALYLEKMLIDEERNFPLTKYATTKGVKKLVKSDHNILYGRFSIKYRNLNSNRPRKEVFNLKNPECQSKFTEVTNDSQKLRKCFNPTQNFNDQCNNFFKSLDDILHQCFRKIRVGKNFTSSEINEELDLQSKLKMFLSKNKCKIAQNLAENKLKQIEENLLKLSSTRNINLVNEHIQNLSTLDGSFSQPGLWKLKNKLLPKELDPPMAKYDEKGNLISAPNALKDLYLQHYVKRLEHRKIDENYIENYEKKVVLWKLRFKWLRSTKSRNWSIADLQGTLKSLKTNKTRDPSGLINELFKSPVIGQDLELAILNLVNGIKAEYFVPFNMQMSNITTIYKKKGSKHDLENDRGIFGLSVFKKIIDKLIYQEKYPLIDQCMSDSNIGARRNKNIKNHLFIIYAIINSVLKGESGCLDIQIYDLVKAFDVLWLDDCMNDLWDTLPSTARDDKLGLIYQTSRTNMVAVNTSVGQTKRVNIPEITTQGGTWGPMLCSNSIDTVGKFAEQDGQFYCYKKIARIIPLAMVDDLLAVSNCGYESTAINTTINSLIELKKLKFHTPEPNKKSKCHYMHI